MSLYPYIQAVAEHFKEHVPLRYERQAEQAERTHPDWVIPRTPFTTVTVNNTYATGVHQDAGDLQAGFSCLSVLRRGQYTGSHLVFAEWRLAVDMQDRDLLLMDAHDWHGNVDITPESEDAERVSTVFYFRTKMIECGSLREEVRRGVKSAERLATA